MVGIVTNGTAILGLGDIGALAGKPVMEGKAVLFKKFAGIDVFDIEINTKDPDEFIHAVKLLEPTFGGINLEDIKAPESFYIEEQLIERMNIPVFHDDQHGTAIITVAGLLNSFELTGKKSSDVKVVICGAGAAGIAIAELIQHIGIKKEQVFLVDTKGVIHHHRNDLNESKKRYVQKTDAKTLRDVMDGSDIFIGVSVENMVDEDMVRSMATNPVIFALANPDPEIPYQTAKAVRSDLIMGTGRSDNPNQVNNVLGFPFIFRGALDVRARNITLEMKLAAARALAELARLDVPDEVSKAYSGEKFTFGPEYLIPKPFDKRVLFHVAPAVAEAAVASGSSRIPYPGREKYLGFLEGIIRV
ncbi:malic enzyme, NAD-binding domain protein [Leptospira borgpetersenii serovar Hardjo-bovis str. Sponselee]|uniref:Malic enzyme, NAD-binding domain protein n=1 Tax=Leptospira borgpetersenii serovar Hardjo-bovis str. Sponselee TaxID=1303729 RepID=M6BN58_LEPBO|nr:malate dehydrogenase [Leptospira borgpetersenii serovar Hardjo]AMX62947.1 malate dehydrogenase [Leptospira borgpetersenii serovar Hardjo]AMX66190.1 malate dehydrogenase [Leptospira borgpetersenii serovar Hardjo]AMX69422.1 malate dehydrogenase [Leptospira borgpetersenii serovar Hardjo]EMJ80016.1 malic enzyme, NAD-binding domain protein [Leptospira borgpetersenii serovar Hardjo-bovis str. Sponselee]